MSHDKDLARLRAQLAEAQTTLDAIATGEVDALVVGGHVGPAVFTLESTDLPFRQLVEQMADGAVSLDSSNTVLYCNHAFADLVGASPDKLVGQSFVSLLEPGGQAELVDAIGRGQVARLISTLMANPEPVPVQLTVSPPGTQAGRRTTLLVSDLRLARRLAVATEDRDAAQAENEAKDRFLATLGHELRNPLAALTNALAVLKTMPADPASTRHVTEIMDRQLLQLTGLVDDLLDLTRVAKGKIELKRQSFVVEDMLESLLDGLSSRLAVRRQRVEISCEPRRVAIVADPVRFEQIVVNLITNASRYSGKDSVISLAVEGRPDELSLSVTDHGIGLSSGDLERIFDPFVQVAAGSGGIGIGLTLVRQLAELHGGTIRASSPGLGKGSTFSVTLPRVAIDDLHARAGVSSGPAAGVPLAVLLVDDNVDAVEPLAALLEADGHHVTVVHRGEDALSAAKANPPDLVLLDLGLPDIDGCEVARRLRGDGLKRARLIAVTGYSHDAARAEVKASGFDGHVVKPISVEQLHQLAPKARVVAAAG